MSEIERELRVVLVEYVCDDCGEGTMSYYDTSRSCDGSKMITHVCSNCEKEAWLGDDQKYPFRRYYYRDAEPLTAPEPVEPSASD